MARKDYPFLCIHAIDDSYLRYNCDRANLVCEFIPKLAALKRAPPYAITAAATVKAAQQPYGPPVERAIACGDVSGGSAPAGSGTNAFVSVCPLINANLLPSAPYTIWV